MAAMIAVAVVPAPGANAADAPATDPGTGDAIAQTWKIDPRAGSLSIGIAFGQALANHSNEVARAAAQAINLGVVGTTLGAPGCDGGAPTLANEKQPQPLRVDSRDDGAAQGKNEDENDQGVPLPWHKYAQADSTPFGQATTTTSGQTVQGLLSMGAGVAHSESGLVNGVRQAKATVDIASLNLANVVQLSGLHWEAVYQSSGAAPKISGTFSIGYAVINGAPVPTQDPSATLAMANAALNPLGLALTPGGTRQTGGVEFVDPLRISVVPNSTRDALASQIIANTQQVRQPLFDAFLAGSCKFADGITVYDILVGSVTGAGSFNLELGGVQAASHPITANRFKLEFNPLETIGGDVPAAPTSGDGTFDPAPAPNVDTPTTTPAAVVPAPKKSKPKPQPATLPAANAASVAGTRGGALAGVGLTTLALLAAAAEGDRRKMRRAQRQMQAAEE